MKNARKYLLTCATAALVLSATGCSDPSTRSDSAVQRGLKYDSAYLTLAKAQNANSTAYSKAILETDPPADVEKFASTVVSERATEGDDIERLQKAVNIHGTPTITESADLYEVKPADLGITADGKTPPAPRSVSAYIKQMTLLDESAIDLASKQNVLGGPGTRRFSQQVAMQRKAELDALSELK